MNRYEILMNKSSELPDEPSEEMNKSSELPDEPSEDTVTFKSMCARDGVCEWGTDGIHSNEFCIKCFKDRPPGVDY